MVTKAVLSKSTTDQHLVVDGFPCATIWGKVTEVEEPSPNHPWYLVCINGTDIFLHVDEVEWEISKEQLDCSPSNRKEVQDAKV